MKEPLFDKFDKSIIAIGILTVIIFVMVVV